MKYIRFLQENQETDEEEALVLILINVGYICTLIVICLLCFTCCLCCCTACTTTHQQRVVYVEKKKKRSRAKKISLGAAKVALNVGLPGAGDLLSVGEIVLDAGGEQLVAIAAQEAVNIGGVVVAHRAVSNVRKGSTKEKKSSQIEEQEIV